MLVNTIKIAKFSDLLNEPLPEQTRTHLEYVKNNLPAGFSKYELRKDMWFTTADFEFEELPTKQYDAMSDAALQAYAEMRYVQPLLNICPDFFETIWDME